MADDNKIENLPTAILSEDVTPQGNQTLIIEIPAEEIQSMIGMVEVKYQLQINGEVVGDVITGYVIMLPQEVAELEEEIQEKIEEWIETGQGKLEDLIDQVWADIQEAAERKLEEAANDVFEWCQTLPAGLIFGFVLLHFRNRKRYFEV